MKYGLILADTNRSREYLKTIIHHKLFPSIICIYSDTAKNSLLKKIRQKKIKYKYFRKKNINDKIIVKYLLKQKLKNFIYSGYPGEIVGKQILNKKNIIHFHSGLLPKYKGSTTIYYSLILEKKIFCTCLILNKKIDEGKILFIKKFVKPKNLIRIEDKFDHFIRAKTLISFLKYGPQKIKFKKKNYSHYYIAHPLVRFLVLNKSIKEKKYFAESIMF